MQGSKVNRPKSKRVLGIDFGLVRLGLALSDERQIIATPLMTVTAEKRSEQTMSKMQEVIAKIEDTYECQIEEIVVGMPLMMSGKSGFLADEVNHFVQLLGQVLSIPLHTWDERLSTVQAERSLREGYMTRKQRSKVVDRISAAIILQTYLDHKNLSKQNNLES